MQEQLTNNFLTIWLDELKDTLVDSNTLCVALFSLDGHLLFANSGMRFLLKDDPCSSLINPTYNKLVECKQTEPLIYEGYLTFGDYVSVDTSIYAKVYKKNEQLLIIGGVDTTQLVVQNSAMHHLNREISNLQRQLIKEKFNLESTLSKLNQANTELVELNATKDKFFSIISHDLKNPFNALLGFSELLLEPTAYPPEVARRFAQTIHSASKEAYSLLENLLQWSRIQTAQLTAKPQNIALHELIDDILILCEPMARTKSIDLQIIGTASGAVMVEVDKEMIKTVIRNLLTNAIKFTYARGLVSIEAEEWKDQVLITISDTGLGIAREVQEKLFHIENKVSKQGTAGESGSGLGLLLCREFVEQNGGRIWVESELGKGSRFKFTIPLSKNMV